MRNRGCKPYGSAAVRRASGEVAAINTLQRAVDFIRITRNSAFKGLRMSIQPGRGGRLTFEKRLPKLESCWPRSPRISLKSQGSDVRFTKGRCSVFPLYSDVITEESWGYRVSVNEIEMSRWARRKSILLLKYGWDQKRMSYVSSR